MILVPHPHFQTRRKHGLVEGETHVVALQQEAVARPSGGAPHFPIRAGDVFDSDDFHGVSAPAARRRDAGMACRAGMRTGNFTPPLVW